MKKGLLLINVGTPEKPESGAVRRYLKDFLSDKRVIDLPAPLRYLLLYIFILPFRPGQSAHAYQSIWTDEGSPLSVYSQELLKKLSQRLEGVCQIALGMRYARPNIQEALKTLEHCEELTILPLYPQYSSAASGSALEEVLRCLQKRERIPRIRVINEFYAHPAFLQAQANRIKALLKPQDYLLFSYHGIPERQIQKISCKKICASACNPVNEKNAACYRAQCYETSRLLAQALTLDEQRYSTAFQSRLGKTPWIRPFTDIVFEDLAARGIRHLLVACPSFVSDCLETLEEIGIRGKKQWLQAGGQTFTLVPCLNAEDDWMAALETIVEM